MAVSKERLRETVGVPLEPGTASELESGNIFSNQILILFSAPLLAEDGVTSIEKLAIQQEIDAIEDIVKEAAGNFSIEIVVKVATVENLQTVFSSRKKPLMIHFIGHGLREETGTALILENATGIATAFTPEELADALAHQQEPPCQLALLNSCYSEGLAKVFERVKVSHVVVVDAEEKILDEAAKCFARQLYWGLLNENFVSNSFLSGRKAILNSPELKEKFDPSTFKAKNYTEAFKFQLLPDNAHNEPLNIEPSPKREIFLHQWKKTNVPGENPQFVGRRILMHEAISALTKDKNRCVVLHGMGGIGKTQIARTLGNWFLQRDRFGEGVWYLNLERVEDSGEMIKLIKQTCQLKSYPVTDELSKQQVLLILDDLDRLVDSDQSGVVEQINELIKRCRRLKLLITCRKSLVRKLELSQQIEVPSMGAAETREIFTQYLPEEQWQQDDNNQENFNKLVNFLDGYPLAIKLAASYMKEEDYSVTRLWEELGKDALKVLETDSSVEKKEESLRLTLDLSFKRISPLAQEIFTQLIYFPSGLSEEMAAAVWGERGEDAVRELYKLSMGEKVIKSDDWRIDIPEPARVYAKGKLDRGRDFSELASEVLSYYHLELFLKDKTRTPLAEDYRSVTISRKKVAQEKANLVKFLDWGYANEKGRDGVSHSARITALLTPFRESIHSEREEFRARLDSALKAAKRVKDEIARGLIEEAIQKLKIAPPDITPISSRKTEADLVIDLGEGIELEMVAIPKGTFMMGSPKGEGRDRERPQHQVDIQPFCLGKYPITQEQWQIVMGNNPSHFRGEKRPVERVTWDDAKEFCDRLAEKTGEKYRLPTEAEWEYACRAGTTTASAFGGRLTEKQANCGKQETSEVGSYPANDFGLYDMHGNVWEWCEDDWDYNYEGAPNNGSAWLSENSTIKVVRGGSWFYDPDSCRSAYRGYSPRDNHSDNIGFRVVCVAPRTT